MERNKVKQGIMLITYAAILILLLVYCKDIIHGLGSIIELFKAFLIGIVFAFILNQPFNCINRLYREKLHMKENIARKLGIISTYVIVVAVIATVVGIVIPQLVSSIQKFVANFDFYVNNLQYELDFFTQQLHLGAIDLSNLMSQAEHFISEFDGWGGTVVPKIVSATGTMVSFFANLVIAIAFSVYLITGKQRILSQANRLLKAFIPQNIYDRMKYVLDIVVTSFKNYIIGQSIEAVILGSLCFIGMMILRLDYAGMVSMVVALTAMIPILGAYIGGMVAVILLFMVSPIKAGIFLAFFVILQQVENNVIYPRVVGGRIGLPGIWVLLAITVGGKLGGIVGMLFGVPTATVIYTLLKNSVYSQEKRKERLSCKK